MSPSCNGCKKTAPEVLLKHCAKCMTTMYCSQGCQKGDWKSHKQACGKTGGSAASPYSSSGTTAATSPPKGLDRPTARPFTCLDQGTWLHDRPETDVYRLLLDAYRMRVQDDYMFGGRVGNDSIYGGARNGLRGFRRFLSLAESRSGLLPPWWDASKQEACERLGMDASQWQYLGGMVEKSDVIEHYGDSRFPMQLRMFGEAVYLQGPGGAVGTSMRKLMVSMEEGGSRMVDVSPL